MATWTQEQVDALNSFQSSGKWHPFTCDGGAGGDRCDAAHKAYQAEHGGDFGQLAATTDGWICPVCGYKQDWAHGFMMGVV